MLMLNLSCLILVQEGKSLLLMSLWHSWHALIIVKEWGANHILKILWYGWLAGEINGQDILNGGRVAGNEDFNVKDSLEVDVTDRAL